MKPLSSKRMLAMFREVVEESSRVNAPSRKKAIKSLKQKSKRAKPGRKLRVAAE